MQKEDYTSGCSALDLEPINKTYYKKSRRVKRGLFKSNKNIYINADVNGSLNILRKFNSKCISELIKLAESKGYVTNSVKFKIA